MTLLIRLYTRVVDWYTRWFDRHRLCEGCGCRRATITTQPPPDDWYGPRQYCPDCHDRLDGPAAAPRPEWGCCGCGAELADVVVSGPTPDGVQVTEGYCWRCVDSSPTLRGRPQTVFAGHER